MRALTWSEAIVVLLAATCVFQGLKWQPWRLSVNTTISEPYGLYAYRHSVAPGTQELAMFKYKSPDWALGRYSLNGAIYLKRVGASAGDVIKIKDRTVSACNAAGCHILGVGLPHDSAGRSLPVPPASMEGVIPPGFVYMQSTDVANSYDSRYYGLVPVSRVIGKAYPLLTWR
jgi:conjugative transfer signal peptidase TraF